MAITRQRNTMSPSDKSVEYEYADNDMSVTYNGMEEVLDLFSVANSFGFGT